MRGQRTSPEGPLNNASFRAAIVAGQIYYSQQLNLIHYKALPRKSAELLLPHLTICVQSVLILYFWGFPNFVFRKLNILRPSESGCDKELIFLTETIRGFWLGYVVCVWHIEMGDE